MNKLRCVISFLFILFINFIYNINITTSKTVSQNSKSVFYFNKGEKLISDGDTLAAIKAFETAIKKDRKYSEAYHRLARIHIAIGKLENRIKAREFLNQAVRFDSKNITYLHTQLEFYYHIRFFYTAKKTAEKILKLNSKDAESYYILGRMSEMKWLKYNDMQDKKERRNPSPIDEPIFVFFSDFIKKDLTEAMDYYKKAIMCDPTFADAHYRLAFIYYEKKMYKKMEKVLLEALKVSPDNKDYHQFLGLCYFKMNRITESIEAYNKAITLMQPEELSLIEAVDLVSTPEDGEIFRTASDENKLTIQYKYWKQRDPLFLSEGNERKLEHYGRMAYANLRFSNRLKGLAGWQTAQGNVYIRFGQPTNHYKTWPKINEKQGEDYIVSDFGSMDAQYNQKVQNKNKSQLFQPRLFNPKPDKARVLPVKHSESTWYYPGFSIKFEDINFDGHYNFFNYSEFSNLIKKQPENYEFVNPEKRIKFSFSFARFFDEDKKNILEVYQNISKDEIITSSQDKSIVRGIFLFDQNWKEEHYLVKKDPYLANYKNRLLVGWDRLQVRPGIYHLVVEFMDKYSGKAGQLRKVIEIPEEKNSDLCLSDIIMAWEIESYKGEDELTRGGVKIVPNTTSEYSLESTIPIFFEIYNLALDLEGKTNYRVTFTIKSSTGENKRGIIQRIFDSSKTPTQIGTSYDYIGNSQTDFIYHSLTLADPEKIKYLLTIEIEDLNKNKMAYKEVSFLLK